MSEDSQPDVIEPEPATGVVLVDAQEGTFEELKADTVDPSDVEEKETDSRYGLPKFLSWTKKIEGEKEYWEAIGKDKTVYRIVEKDPAPKDYVVQIIKSDVISDVPAES